jgi:hypothetical protein
MLSRQLGPLWAIHAPVHPRRPQGRLVPRLRLLRRRKWRASHRLHQQR